MSDVRHHVLFVCTGNSARSILAEALMNQMGRDLGFQAHSAGSQPRGSVHPLTLQTLQRHHLPTDGLYSKSWQVFAQPEAPQMSFVFTVCDQAAGEACPVWPGQPVTAHWGLPDPAAVPGSEAACEKAFLDAFVTLRRRIELLLALPLAKLDAMALHHEVRQIGHQ